MKHGNSGDFGDVKPSGLTVLLQTVIEGMEFQSDTVATYLNIATGDIEMIAEETFAAIDDGEDVDPMTGEPLDRIRAGLDSKDFIPLPDRFEINEYGMMERYTESVSEPSASDLLLITLRGAGAFRRFKDTLQVMGLADDWYEFRGRAYEEIAIEWCKEHNIEYRR